jgi:hypothetical protein
VWELSAQQVGSVQLAGVRFGIKKENGSKSALLMPPLLCTAAQRASSALGALFDAQGKLFHQLTCRFIELSNVQVTEFQIRFEIPW